MFGIMFVHTISAGPSMVSVTFLEIEEMQCQELITRALKSEVDIENGDYYSLDEVKKISESW